METTALTLRQRYNAWEQKTSNWDMIHNGGWFRLTLEEDGSRTYAKVPLCEQNSAYYEIKEIFSELDVELAEDLSFTWFIHGWALDLPLDTWSNDKWDMLVSQMGD